MSIFSGSGTAMITPFINGEVDYKALDRLIDFQLKNGTDALIMCGTTGEASTMTFEEKINVITYAVEKVNKKIPVIAGTGGNNTIEVIKLSKAACKAGASALLIVTPYYNKTTQEGLIAHYNCIADEVNIPIIVYNVPSRTGLNVLPETMQKLLAHPNIIGIKEASGNIEQIVRLAAICPDCDIYCGNDDHVLPVLSVGGVGVISTVSNIVPKDMHELCQAYFDGNLIKAKQLQFKLLPICKAAFSEVNPIPIKTMLSMVGFCGGELRLPLIPPKEITLDLLTKTIDDYGILREAEI